MWQLWVYSQRLTKMPHLRCSVPQLWITQSLCSRLSVIQLANHWQLFDLRELDCDESEEEDLIVATIETSKQKDWTIGIGINSQSVTFKIDTGGQCNVMSSETYPSKSLVKSNSRLIAFGGHWLKTLGRASLLCEHKGRFWLIEFEVLDNVSNILGLSASTEMKLVQRVETLDSDTLCLVLNTIINST